MPRTVRILSGLLLVCLCTGCSNQKLFKAQELYRQADLDKAESTIRTYAQKEGDGVDRVIAYLELGNVLRANGARAMSNDAFATADEAIDEIDTRAETEVSKEGLALLTNLNALPYRGCNYDRIMLSTYRALNYLQLGELDAARVELRRAYERQAEAVERNAKRIEKLKEEAEAAKEGNSASNQPGVDVARSQNDDRFQATVAQQYGELDQYEAYADYVNPFTEFLQGLYFMSAAADASDLERSRVAMRRVAGMVPGNGYLKEDLALAERVAAGEPLEPITYVIFETGTAPSRGEIRLDIPLFFVNNEVDYVGANFPRLIMNPQYVSSVTAAAAGKTYSTALLADMDAIIAQEFKQVLPAIITRTLLAAGTKAAIAWGLRQAAETQDQWVALGTRIATTAYMAVANEADLRTWATLPKQIQYARFPTPQDGKVQLTVGGQLPQTVQVSPGQVNVIMVRSITPLAPPTVAHFEIKDETKWPTASAN